MIVKEQKPDFYNINGLVFIPAYDRKEDVYRDLKGNVLPTVSQIIRPLLTFSSFYALKVENVVYKLIEANLNNKLYSKPIKEDYMAYLSAFYRWKDKTNPFIEVCGMRLACVNFAGMFDFLGIIDGELWVINFTTEALSIKFGPMMAAYAMLMRGWYEQLTGKIEQINRGVLKLNYDGTYIFKKYDDLEDYEIFNHLLAVKRWKMANEQF